MIDTHQHFWRLSRGGYDWMPEDSPVLRRDHEPADLEPLIRDCGVAGTVAVQADDNVGETEFLLSLAAGTEWILGVVGWVDLELRDAPDRIRGLAENPKFLGIRPMIQGIADLEWMLRPELAPGLEALRDLDLTFDALILQRHLPVLRRFLDLYPDLRVVIDHCAKPEFREGRFRDWADGMTEAAARPSVFCKLSGLLTEAGAGAGQAEIGPYIAHAVEAFGPERLLFGSDWPVLNLAGSYGMWMRLLEGCFEQDLRTLRQEIGRNAAQRAYPRLRA